MYKGGKSRVVGGGCDDLGKMRWGLDYGIGSGDGEKWLEFRYILKVEMKVFVVWEKERS